MKLAERAAVTGQIVAVAIVAGASLFIIKPDCEMQPEAIIVTTPAPRETPCPAFVSEQFRLDDARVSCVRGTFLRGGEPAWFAIADYTTTEPWQRMMVLSDDGELLVERTDRPTLAQTQVLHATDVDSDGTEEIANGDELISVSHGRCSGPRFFFRKR